MVRHYTVHSEGNTSPRDFLNFTRNAVIRFLRERPQNKVQLNLICMMTRVDPTTGEVTNEEQASFNSKQESVFESTKPCTTEWKPKYWKRSRRTSRTEAAGC